MRIGPAARFGRQRAVRTVFAGLAAGAAMGWFLKGVEELRGIAVYRLLLGVDYIPLLREVLVSELSQFLLHLLISVSFAAGAGGFCLLRRMHPGSARRFITVAGLAVGLLLYPTTMLSAGTPALLDPEALLWWLAAHAGYGRLTAVLLFPRSSGPAAAQKEAAP
ncbi:hypothetical protein [Gorillibacterium sp. sgz5001074]|uniref:hypothetical protein n=1 Tax=Gorillibacterium sp. sgz5001074 TaxID=3446695 RepID=UPI003F662C80